jgi:hypothetical protein
MTDDLPEPCVTDPDGTYADRLTVVYRAVRDQRGDTDIGPAVVMITHPHGTRLAFEKLRRELERLARDSGETPRPFVSTTRVGHTSWGADGASVTFLLSVGGQVSGYFIVEGLKRIGRVISRSSTVAEHRPITEEEARYWADAALRARFEDIDTGKLQVTTLRLGQSTAIVELRGADNSAYGVELELVDGLIMVAEVSRTYPEQGSA